MEGKSNEIPAIPALLDLLELKGAVVSIDAVGCQKHIATTIQERGADYLLGLKSNQPALLEEVELAFVHYSPTSRHEHHEKSHGRVETRVCEVIDDPTMPSQADQWPGVRSMVRVQFINHHVRDGKTPEQVRFYLSSLKGTTERMGALVRQYWGIENSLHWGMDVTFQRGWLQGA